MRRERKGNSLKIRSKTVSIQFSSETMNTNRIPSKIELNKFHFRRIANNYIFLERICVVSLFSIQCSVEETFNFNYKFQRQFTFTSQYSDNAKNI